MKKNEKENFKIYMIVLLKHLTFNKHKFDITQREFNLFFNSR